MDQRRCARPRQQLPLQPEPRSPPPAPHRARACPASGRPGPRCPSATPPRRGRPDAARPRPAPPVRRPAGRSGCTRCSAAKRHQRLQRPLQARGRQLAAPPRPPRGPRQSPAPMAVTVRSASSSPRVPARRAGVVWSRSGPDGPPSITSELPHRPGAPTAPESPSARVSTSRRGTSAPRCAESFRPGPSSGSSRARSRRLHRRHQPLGAVHRLRAADVQRHLRSLEVDGLHHRPGQPVLRQQRPSQLGEALAQHLPQRLPSAREAAASP